MVVRGRCGAPPSDELLCIAQSFELCTAPCMLENRRVSVLLLPSGRSGWALGRAFEMNRTLVYHPTTYVCTATYQTSFKKQSEGRRETGSGDGNSGSSVLGGG